MSDLPILLPTVRDIFAGNGRDPATTERQWIKAVSAMTGETRHIEVLR